MLHRYFSLLQTLKRMQAVPDSISVCLEALTLYPDNRELRYSLQVARDVCVSVQRMAVFSNMSFEDTKVILSYGSYTPRVYPWMPQKYRTRESQVIQVANKELQIYSSNLEIRHSSVQGGTDCYGMFAKRRIRACERILNARHPFSISPEQALSQCYNCFQVLAKSKEVRRFECCQNTGYCSSTCRNIARTYYHKAVCGKDFSSVINRAQRSYGGKSEGPQHGSTGRTELSEFTGWHDKPTIGYPKLNFRFPDRSPLVLIRVLATCLQAQCHPLEHPNIAQLTDGVPVKSAWSLNGMVIGPLKVLETFGIDIFSDVRYETRIVRTL